MTASPDTESPTTEKRTMRAITIVGEGELGLAELPGPTPGPGEVLVDVVAAGIAAGVLLLAIAYFWFYSRHRLIAGAPEEEFAQLAAAEDELS